MSHSKRNTSRAVFTSYERALAKQAWTVSSARLTRDSFLPFAACALCLTEPAADPVACPAGDVFCRECALSNILAQKKEQRRLAKRREQEARERAERRAREDAEAQARAIREFELVQAGLGGNGGGGGGSNGRQEERRGSSSVPPRDSSNASTATPTATAPEAKLLEGPTPTPDGDADHQLPSKKRKFALDEDELRRVADADRARARRALEAERAAAQESRAMPAFWAPSVTPSSNTGNVLHGGEGEEGEDGDGREETNGGIGAHHQHFASGDPRCPAAHRDRPHTYSLHTLIAVQFAVDESHPKKPKICPACSKTLTNTSRAVLAKPCGHVLCRSCVHQFVKPLPGGVNGNGHGSSANGGGAALYDPHAPPGTTGKVRCYVCDISLEEGEEDDVPTKKEKKDKKDKKDKKEKKKDRIKPGLVELRSEGTGFSAGGASEVKKDGVAFQC